RPAETQAADRAAGSGPMRPRYLTARPGLWDAPGRRGSPSRIHGMQGVRDEPASDTHDRMPPVERRPDPEHGSPSPSQTRRPRPRLRLRTQAALALVLGLLVLLTVLGATFVAVSREQDASARL